MHPVWCYNIPENGNEGCLSCSYIVVSSYCIRCLGSPGHCQPKRDNASVCIPITLWMPCSLPDSPVAAVSGLSHEVALSMCSMSQKDIALAASRPKLYRRRKRETQITNSPTLDHVQATRGWGPCAAPSLGTHRLSNIAQGWVNVQTDRLPPAGEKTSR